jgi:hypothetical protein
MQGMRKRRCTQGMKAQEHAHMLREARESARIYVQMRECKQMDFYYILLGK